MSQNWFLTKLQELNEQQRQAVETTEGPVLVIAGPGSGKTQILSLRVANILYKNDVLPNNILCLTFTEAAAINMQERLRHFLGRESNKVAIHTFHSLGNEIINHNSEFFFFGGNYKVADELAKIEIVDNLLEDCDWDNPLKTKHSQQGFIFTKDILSRIADLKKGGLTPSEFSEILAQNQDFLQQVTPLLQSCFESRIDKNILPKITVLLDELKNITKNYLKPNSLAKIYLQSLQEAYNLTQNEAKITTKYVTAWKNSFLKKEQDQLQPKDLANLPKHLALADIYHKYQQNLHQKGLYDYEDMLLETVQVLENNPDVAYNYQEKFLYILVDEFQDTNGVQLRLLQNLINLEITNYQPNILAVGDDDQAVYKFQGANLENIWSFQKTYQNINVISLFQNYRSKQDILDLATQVINQSSKRLADLNGINKVLVSQKNT